MPSTFFGLTIGASGLNAFQAAINTTANNVSNVETEGYSKQKVNLQSSSALRVFQKYGSISTGVIAESVTQVRDAYYDDKFWTNQSFFGYYEKKLYYIEQIEDLYTDSPARPGFSTIFGDMFNSLNEVSTNAGDPSKRNVFTSDATKMATYFNSSATQLENLQTAINEEIKMTVDTINSIARKIALLNKQINVIEMENGHANELRDQRSLLVDDLSKIVAVEVEEAQVANSNYPDMYTGATTYKVKLNGQVLVNIYNYNTLKTVTRPEKYNQSDVEGLYDIVWTNGGSKLNVMGNNQIGVLRSLFETRDGNDMKNLTGTVFGSGSTSTEIKIVSPSISHVAKMNLPPSGAFTVNNTQYNYTSFKAEYETKDYMVKGALTTLPVLYDKNGRELNYDNEGNPVDSNGNPASGEPVIQYYTFTLEKGIPASKLGQMDGMKLTVGESVNYKGVPYYQNQMNEFLCEFSKAFNDIEHTGEDLYGDQGQSFFTAKNLVDGSEFDFADADVFSGGMPVTVIGPTGEPGAAANTYYQLMASNVMINKKILSDPRLFAATTNVNNGIDMNDLIDDLEELESKVTLFRGGGSDKFLQCIYADITVDAQECAVFKQNYENIQTAIQRQRDSVSGVDEDEEAMDLVKFQNAYNLNSKVISVLAEMYDQLILNTAP